MSDNETDIRESIIIILKTAKGERVMRPRFGSSIGKFIFEGTDTGTLTMIKEAVKEAIAEWEPRVGNVAVEAAVDKEEGNRIIISLSYEILATSTVCNIDYPFYIGG